jgi:N6-L-threonylcarbamoyladenine synthase
MCPLHSSCDDSCASLVSAPVNYFQDNFSGAAIHNSIVLKQDHGITKGIEPLNAANAHSANLPLAIRESLVKGQESGVIQDADQPVEIDAIAVTRGPGMNACLSQGLSNAKLLSTLWTRPLLYVHHMVAHTLTPFLSSDSVIKMPFLVLLLSGGHTQLVLCLSPTQFKILATTQDDSIGDAFDKVARMLQIEFNWATTSPGSALESFASPTRSEEYKLPVSFRNKAEFS